MRKIVFGLLPIVLLAIPVTLFLAAGGPLPFGARILVGERPPIEELVVRRVRLEEDLIELTIVNDGPDPVTVSQLLVNGSYWAFETEGDRELSRLESTKLLIEYPWNTGDDQHVTIVTENGVTFPVTIPAAVASPRADLRFASLLAFIGFLIGVVPVGLGLLWYPFLKSLAPKWYDFFLALTIGLLIFLGVDSVAEAIEIVPDTPGSLDAVGVLLIGFALSFLVLFSLSRGRPRGDSSASGAGPRLMAFSAALGIGVHNLGEGLAVGSAFAFGNISLGAALIVGFMIHNLTEGLPIVAPMAKEKTPVSLLVGLGLLAGAPAILGTLIGGYAYSAIWSVFFLGVGAGAIFQVVIEIAASMGRKSLTRLFAPNSVAGLVAGLVLMYATGIIIAG